MASPLAAAPIKSPQSLAKSPKKELEFIITPKKAVDNNSESDGAPDSPDLINPLISSNVSMEPPEQNSEDQNVEFRTLFRLPASEKIVEDFYCAYFKTILHQGKMYVSHNYVCFHSNIFGFRIIVAIAIREIASISKQNTAYLVPNAIEIKTIDGSSHFFGSFMFRDQTYAILTELLRIHKKRAKAGEESALTDLSDRHVTSDSGDESDSERDDNDDEEEESDSDDDGADSESGYDTDTSSGEDNKTTVIKNYFDPSLSAGGHSVPIAKAAMDESKQTKSSGSNAGNNEGGKETRGNDGNNGDNQGRASGSGSGAGGDDGNKRNNDGAEHSIEESQTNEDANEEDDEEDRVSIASDNVADASQIPWNDIFIDPAKVKPKEIYKGILPADLQTSFLTMFTGWDLERIYHTVRNDTELIVGDYEPAKEGIGRVREIKFVSPIKNPIGPKQSRIITHQRIILQKGRKKCYNQFSMVSVDVPYGDCFKILAYVELTELEDKTTELKIFSGVYFLRTVLLKWKIEDAVSKESSQSLAVWAEQAKKLIVERPSKPLPKKHTKSKKRSTKKKSRRPRKESVAIAPPPVFVPTSEPPPPAEEEQEGLLFSILTKLIGVLLTLPTTLITYSVHIPLWIVIFVGFMLTFFFLPQQYAIISTLNKVESELTLYKHQSIIMEQEMNYLLFNITHSATYEDFEKRLTQWLTLKKDRDPDVLRSLLSSTMFELNQLRTAIHEQHKKIQKFESSAYDKQQPEQPHPQANVKLDPSTAVMMQMLQMNSQNSTNINMLIWVALGAGVLSMLLKLIKG